MKEDYYITHAGVDIDDKGYITQDWVPMRYNNQFIEGSVQKAQYIDVANVKRLVVVPR